MDAELVRSIIKEELAPLMAELDTIRENVEFLKWTLTPIESKIEAQIESFNALSSNLDYLKWTLTPMDSSLTSMRGEISALKKAHQDTE